MSAPDFTSTACPPPALTRAVLLLMATASGLAVASNYYAQPLLHTLGQYFGLSSAGAGTIVTVAQLSYAAGLMLLVPLGDMFERRKLIVTMTALAAIGLTLNAFSPNVALLLAGTALTGFLSVVAQVLVPFAATLAAPEARGKAVGTVMGGLLLGVLLARTAAGAVADLGGWRLVYGLAAGLMLVMAVVLWRVLPPHHEHSGLSYPGLLRSVWRLFIDEPLFRARSTLGALAFSVFSTLWTSLTFLLAGPPFHFTDTTIGLFGLAGAAGALAASRFGRLADRGLGNITTLASATGLLGSWILLWFAPHSILSLLAGVLLLDLAVQGIQITNQSAIYRLNARARSRLTSGYMTCFFIGGAFGSLVSAMAFARGGWNGVVAVGAILSALTLLYAAFSSSVRIPGVKSGTA